ncbi:MAG: HAMP domain-containing histidine kinase, partial [Clostridia bacterium]|nr:HAMP domain-containing histidine kinase [Clostridia bacterium]
YTPLKNLQDAANAVSHGDFTVHADETGNDEFASLAIDFNSMTDKINDQINQLKTVADEKQRMLDNLGHEMRTPLTSIYGYAEYAFRNRLEEEKQLQTMLNIMEESKRLKRIGDILLEGAYLRENKIEKSRVSAAKLLERIQNIFIMRAGDKRVKITYKCEDIYVCGDKALLEILISNLTENALRACKEGGEIELGAYIIENAKTVYVRDNGIGMTNEQLAHITEPFYRTDKARSRRDGGTGLGLALCKTIADSHGAELYFESAPEKGTTAYLRFKTETESEK